MRKRLARLTAVLAAMALALVAPVASAGATTGDAAPAEGAFSFRTANGILPTWQRAGLRLSAAFPGSALTNARLTNATVTLPLVARAGSTNYAAGGIRITNIGNGASITCGRPAIDTRAGVVDCVLSDGSNLSLLAIRSIDSRRSVTAGDSTTLTYHGMALRVANQRVADALTDELDVAVFSPSVTFATGSMTVTSKH